MEKYSSGDVCERCRWRMKGGERVAAVKIWRSGQRATNFGHRNRPEEAWLENKPPSSQFISPSPCAAWFLRILIHGNASNQSTVFYQNSEIQKYGELSEWSKVQHSKCCVPKRNLGFESLTLRQALAQHILCCAFCISRSWNCDENVIECNQ